MQRKTLSMLVAAALAGVSMAAAAGPVTDEMILNDAKSAGDVLTFGMGTNGQRYSTLAKINTGNVKKLVPAWAFQFGGEKQRGQESQPVIHDGKVIVQADVQKGSFLAVYDLESGKEVWKQPRKDVPTWSTPTVVDSAGRKQIAVNGWHHIGGYDFATGQELWKLDGGGDIPVPTPVFAHGLIYFTSAHG
jgi:glucose dehydrogenase